MRYAVTAATGKLGRQVVRDLLSHVPASAVVATATRDVERILGRAGVSFHDHMLASVGQRMKEQS